MAGITLSLDPTSEDSANVALLLNDGTKFRAISFQAPPPDKTVTYATSADTEGGLPGNLHYENRTITLTVRIYGSTQSDMLTQLGYLQQKCGKINEEKGTLQYTASTGTSVVFDLLEAQADAEVDNMALANNRVEATVTFVAKPFWRAGVANEVTQTDHAETTLPCAIGTDTIAAGDVPAYARLVIDEDQAVDQLTAIWGIRSRYYDSSADAALFYEAEGRTVLGGAATAVGPTGASGAGSNTVLQGTLTPSYLAMLSTQATGAGNHFKHIGTYRVFARLQRPTTNTGAVSVALEWGEGDFRRKTQNTAVTYAAGTLQGAWTLADLGLVSPSKVVSGTQRWEGRILAKSTVTGDDLYVDWIMLVPVDEGYGQVKITPAAVNATSYTARDEFDQTAGNLTGGKTTNNISAITAASPGVITVTAHGLSNGALVWIEGVTGTGTMTNVNGYQTVANATANTFTTVNTTGVWASGGTVSIVGKALPSSGTGGWYGTGSTTDFTMDTTGHTAQRTATDGVARYAIAPATGALTSSVVQADVKLSARVSSGFMGVVARYADVSNWLALLLNLDSGGANGALSVYKSKAGTVTALSTTASSLFTVANLYYTLRLSVDANGNYAAYCASSFSGTWGSPNLSGYDADLATGGTLNSGRVGIYDNHSLASTRSYDNFQVFSAPADAALFASRSLEVRSDKINRQDSGGTLYQRPTSYRGSYFKPPATRREARTLQTIVKLCRGNIDTSADSGTDDLSFRVYTQARGLLLPES